MPIPLLPTGRPLPAASNTAAPTHSTEPAYQVSLAGGERLSIAQGQFDWLLQSKHRGIASSAQQALQSGQIQGQCLDAERSLYRLAFKTTLAGQEAVDAHVLLRPDNAGRLSPVELQVMLPAGESLTLRPPERRIGPSLAHEQVLQAHHQQLLAEQYAATARGDGAEARKLAEQAEVLEYACEPERLQQAISKEVQRLRPSTRHLGVIGAHTDEMANTQKLDRLLHLEKTCQSLGRSLALNPHVPEDQQAASREVSRSLRRNMASTIHATMLSLGTLWRETGEWSGHHLVTLRALSKHNLHTLRQSLASPPLRAQEREFLQRFLHEPLYLSHATSQPPAPSEGQVGLYSRMKLEREGIAFSKNHTEADDRQKLYNHDHVFFALESGQALQKHSSRFGHQMLRFDFSHPAVLQTGVLMLADPLAPSLPDPTRLATLQRLPQAQRDAIRDHFQSRQLDVNDTAFHGAEMRVGMGLAILQAARQHLPESVANDVLSQESLNALMNWLFRPQVMVPRQFFAPVLSQQAITMTTELDVAKKKRHDDGLGQLGGALEGEGDAALLSYLTSKLKSYEMQDDSDVLSVLSEDSYNAGDDPFWPAE